MAVHTVSHLAKTKPKSKKANKPIQTTPSQIHASDRRMNEWMDRWTDGWTDVECSFLAFEILDGLWFFNLIHKYTHTQLIHIHIHTLNIHIHLLHFGKLIVVEHLFRILLIDGSCFMAFCMQAIIVIIITLCRLHHHHQQHHNQQSHGLAIISSLPHSKWGHFMPSSYDVLIMALCGLL